jgi:hypothetical protein
MMTLIIIKIAIPITFIGDHFHDDTGKILPLESIYCTSDDADYHHPNLKPLFSSYSFSATALVLHVLGHIDNPWEIQESQPKIVKDASGKVDCMDESSQTEDCEGCLRKSRLYGSLLRNRRL